MANYNHKIKLSDILDSGDTIHKDDRKEASRRIGARALELMKKDMNGYKSPVTGKNFKHLKDKNYKKTKGTSRSNLRLTGALQGGLKSKDFNYGAKISITGSKNKLKAENHLKVDNDGNTISQAAESKTGVKKREFFPTGEKRLRKGILDQLRTEIEDLIE